MTKPLDLGCFSISLNVADLDASLAFYSALGFTELGGGDQWRIIGNKATMIGLFAEHIEANILTFNPGIAQEWVADAVDAEPGLPEPVAGFTDVRIIERRLKDAGIVLDRPTETPSGPDSIVLKDPDGNLIMIDQFY